MDLSNQVATMIKSLELGRVLKRETVILTFRSEKGYSVIPCLTLGRAEQLMERKKQEGVICTLYPTGSYTEKQLNKKYGKEE